MDLALATALAYAAAAAVQRGQTPAADRTTSWRAFLGLLVHRPRWWVGVATMAVGAALPIIAPAIGSVTLVQPVGALAPVLALPIEARLSHPSVKPYFETSMNNAAPNPDDGASSQPGVLAAGLAFKADQRRENQRPVPPTGPALSCRFGQQHRQATLLHEILCWIDSPTPSYPERKANNPQEREVDMRAKVGDVLTIHGRRVDSGQRVGAVVEVRGEEGPLLVRFGDGTQRWVFPGPDAEITPPSAPPQ